MSKQNKQNQDKEHDLKILCTHTCCDKSLTRHGVPGENQLKPIGVSHRYAKCIGTMLHFHWQKLNTQKNKAPTVPVSLSIAAAVLLLLLF